MMLILELNSPQQPLSWRLMTQQGVAVTEPMYFTTVADLKHLLYWCQCVQRGLVTPPLKPTIQNHFARYALLQDLAQHSATWYEELPAPLRTTIWTV